ncbi:MAG: presqualene diphosphate synthase HpnD [Rhodospirillales bacterium]
MSVAAAQTDTIDAKAHVEAIVKRSKTSFFWAMRRLGEEKRSAMYAVYAFCREVDDIADDPGFESEKLARLSGWRTEIERLFSNNPTNPTSQALLIPKDKFGLRKDDFLALIDGMEMDAYDAVRISDMPMLELYCDRVACAVGRLSNQIFGIEQFTGDQVAFSLGQALQLTNIMRDVHEDAQRNRLYLPQDLLTNHGIDVDNDASAVFKFSSLPDVCRSLAQTAQQRFHEAESILEHCDPVQMRPAIMMMQAYRRIFNRLLQNDWQRFDPPVSLSKFEKLWVVFRYGLF